MNLIIIVLGDIFSFLFTKRLLNTKCAIIFLIYSLFNEIINNVFNRTMTNGAEAVFSVIALYYYQNLQY